METRTKGGLRLRRNAAHPELVTRRECEVEVSARAHSEVRADAVAHDRIDGTREVRSTLRTRKGAGVTPFAAAAAMAAAPDLNPAPRPCLWTLPLAPAPALALTPMLMLTLTQGFGTACLHSRRRNPVESGVDGFPHLMRGGGRGGGGLGTVGSRQPGAWTHPVRHPTQRS